MQTETPIEDLLQQVRVILRTKPQITAVDLKKALGGTKAAAFYAVLLQQARDAETKAAAQLAGEDEAAEEAAEEQSEEEAPELYIEHSASGRVFRFEFDRQKGKRHYFRFVDESVLAHLTERK